MDIFMQGRGDNAEFVLKPAIPRPPQHRARRRSRPSSALSLVFGVRITRKEVGHVGVLHREQPAYA
jgi:hypothetical protein